MARIAETIVEEWLNRRGYFTIRSLKKWPNEIDLLAFHPADREALHVEVNVSTSPRGWIGKKNLAGEKLPEGNDRVREQIEEGIKNFVSGKYLNPNAVDIRDRLWPGHDSWRFMYVYGKLNHPEELNYLKAEGVECCSVAKIQEELGSDNDLPFKTDSDAAHFVDMSKLDLPQYQDCD